MSDELRKEQQAPVSSDVPLSSEMDDVVEPDNNEADVVMAPSLAPPVDEPEKDDSDHGQSSLETPAVEKVEREVVDEAKLKMAAQMENGHSPYDFSSHEPDAASPFEAPISAANIAAGVALLGLLLALVWGWQTADRISRKVDSLTVTLAGISRQVEQQRNGLQISGQVVAGAELARTIKVLRDVEALGDPALAKEAALLRGETETLLRQVAPEKPEGY